MGNRAKENSLTPVCFIFQMLKTIFAATSRVLLFSAWLYVTNNGEFSSIRTLVSYYLTGLVLVIFNFFLNKRRPSFTSSYWIEILLNSLSSVLSYNSFNLAPVLNLRKNSEKEEDQIHESTFVKQLIYFLLMTTMNAGLTVATSLNLSDNMKIDDVNGRPHNLTHYQVQMILVTGWV